MPKQIHLDGVGLVEVADDISPEEVLTLADSLMPAAPAPQQVQLQDISQLPDRMAVQSVTGADQPGLPPVIPGGWKQAGGRFVQGYAGGIAGLPEAIAISADKLGQVVPAIDEGKPLQELDTYKAGQAIREGAARLAPVDPNRPKSFFADTLPQNAGSLAAFLTGGALGKLVKAPAVVTTALMGAGVSGADAYDEAKRSGASDDQAWTSFLVNAGAGTTEALPIARWLGGLDRASGGLVRRAIKEGSEELLQEIFQKAVNNVDARAISGFDPNRPWLQGTGESGAAGFTLGTLVSLLMPGRQSSMEAGERLARNLQQAPTPGTMPTAAPAAPSPVVEPPVAAPTEQVPTPGATLSPEREAQLRAEGILAPTDQPPATQPVTLAPELDRRLKAVEPQAATGGEAAPAPTPIPPGAANTTPNTAQPAANTIQADLQSLQDTIDSLRQRLVENQIQPPPSVEPQTAQPAPEAPRQDISGRAGETPAVGSAVEPQISPTPATEAATQPGAMPEGQGVGGSVKRRGKATAEEQVAQAKAGNLSAFHGSPEGTFTRFQPSDRGIYFTSSRSTAEGYTFKRGAWLSKGKAPKVYPAQLRMENPLVIEAGGARNNNIPVPWQEYKRTTFGNLPANAVSVEEAIKHAFAAGHDGVIIRDVMDTVSPDDKTRSTVFVVKSPEQISEVTQLQKLEASGKSPGQVEKLKRKTENEKPTAETVVPVSPRDAGAPERQVGGSIPPHPNLPPLKAGKTWGADIYPDEIQKGDVLRQIAPTRIQGVVARINKSKITLEDGSIVGWRELTPEELFVGRGEEVRKAIPRGRDRWEPTPTPQKGTPDSGKEQPVPAAPTQSAGENVIKQLRMEGVDAANAKAIIEGRKTPLQVVDELLRLDDSFQSLNSDYLIVEELSDGTRDIGVAPDAGPSSLPPRNYGHQSHVEAIQEARRQGVARIRAVLSENGIKTPAESIPGKSTFKAPARKADSGEKIVSTVTSQEWTTEEQPGPPRVTTDDGDAAETGRGGTVPNAARSGEDLRTNPVDEALNKLKFDFEGGKNVGSFGIVPLVWNTAVDITRSGVKAGMTIARAAAAGIRYIRRNLRGGWNPKATLAALRKLATGQQPAGEFDNSRFARAVSSMLRGQSVPKQFMDIQDKAAALQKYMEEQLRELVKNARVRLREEFKSDVDFDAAVQRLEAYWLGQAPLTSVGGPAVQRAAEQFRQELDALSLTAVNNGLVPDSQVATWLGNTGEWLKRTFLAFDPNSDWNYDQLLKRKNNGDAEVTRIWNEAERYLRTQHPTATNAEIESMMRHLVDRREAESALFGGRSPAAAGKFSTDIGSLLKRKNIPRPLLEWMGQIRDPFARANQSSKWISQFIARNLMQREMAKLGLDMGWFSDSPGGRNHIELYPNQMDLRAVRDPVTGKIVKAPSGNTEAEVTTKVDRRHEPLHGLYTSPEMAEALKEFDGRMNTAITATSVAAAIGRGYLKLVALWKLGKVGLNPASYAVNSMGAVVSRLANGGVNPIHFKDAFMAVASRHMVVDASSTLAAQKARANFLLATKAGVTGKGILTHETEAALGAPTDPQAFRRALKATADVISGEGGPGARARLRKALLDIAKLPGDIGIRFMDDVARVSAFLDELSTSRAANPSFTEDQHVEWAATRASNIYQTYEKLPKIVRDLSNVGLMSPFVSFKIELLRNMAWTAYYGATDITSSNPVLRKNGARRLLGFTSTVLAPLALAALSRVSTMGDDDDENKKKVDALQRWFVPPWDRGEELVIKSWENGRVEYIPMGYLLPTYEVIRLPNEMKKAMRDENPERAVDRIFEGLLSDYFGGGPGQAILETAFNTRAGGRTVTEAEGLRGVQDRAAYLARAMQPGFVNMAQNVHRAVTGEKGRDGVEYSLQGEAAKVAGLRVRTVQVKDALPFTLGDFSRRWRSASKVETTEKSKTSDTARHAEAKQYKERVQAELKRDYKQLQADAKLLGISRGDWLQAEKDARVPEDLR